VCVCLSLSLSLSLAVSMTGFSELLYLQRPKNEERNSKQTFLKFTNLRNITNPIPCSSLTPLQLHFPLLFPLATEVTSLNKSFFFSLVHTHSVLENQTKLLTTLTFFSSSYSFFCFPPLHNSFNLLGYKTCFSFSFPLFKPTWEKERCISRFSGRDSELWFCKKKEKTITTPLGLGQAVQCSSIQSSPVRSRLVQSSHKFE